MTAPLDTDWAAVFDALGHRSAGPIGQGMEGVVHRLDGGLVGKAWTGPHGAGGRRLSRLSAFYEELAAQHLPFATPRIVARHEHRGTAVSIEHELSGTPLTEAHGLSDATVEEATATVVTALAGTEAGPAARALSALGEDTPLWAGHADWPTALAALVRRRAAAFHPVLAAAVPDFDTTLDRLLHRLERLTGRGARGGEAIVHGDICPENLLVDGAGRVTAVLDWGFFTTAGDNAFDASTAAGFRDMYGPEAARRDAALLRRFEALGHDRERLLIYRAAYAVAGANAYGADGKDGHFAWCAAALRRDDVRAALGLRGRAAD
ncbi:phosphotransferase family protein [Streptomyces johnsoniae]|uniref:Aminoglycoside phosphotransferase family protein n=1 Tax=Streptomyces johnsoniae TaxID=3075532 RepID=A0ABU2SCH7_9ACTN|nr:aminoglycoside phosphotransferase family protein [Streptomyces sp. DSM 41886]MDT0446679.1 aminoglycoside phosphotransferase family protein [Streptomyces sp. DSM 41886]